MRIPSGVTDQYVYFVAVDSTDLKTRETGLSSFTVYRSRNGGAASAMTTPTINETDSSNMPGVYELLLDEDMTIDSGDDEQEMVFHITHAGMAPVTRAVTLFRPKITAGNTLGVESDGDLTKVNALDGHTAQTGDSFARIGAAGASLTDLGGMSTAMKAEVNAEADTAISDAALATAANLAIVDTVVDGIATVLSGITSLAEWLGLIAGKQTGDATARTELRATGAGSGTFDETTDSIEAIRDTEPLGTAMRGTDSAATATALATAQTDLDTLTGSDGVTLATSQPNYAPATAAALTTVEGKVDTIDTVVDAILLDTGTDGVAISSSVRDAIATSLLDLANGVETGYTVRQGLRLIAAACAGKLSGAATATNTIRSLDDSADRITATVDADGNRSAVTHNA